FKVIHELPPKKRTEGLAALSTHAAFYASRSSVHGCGAPEPPAAQSAAVVLGRRARPSVAAYARPLRDPRVGGDAAADAGLARSAGVRVVPQALPHPAFARP